MTFDVIIPSARAANLIPCVRAILAHEPALPAGRIVIVDDGARRDAAAGLPGVRWINGVKPFNFARNINRGLAAVSGDAILLNDDAVLATPGGFGQLARAAAQDDIGLCSAAVDGMVGNVNQRPQAPPMLRDEPGTLAFVCVWLPTRTRRVVGPLDERFTGYGFEDDDYSRRVLRAGLRLTVFDGCVVRHDGELPSTFRTRRDHAALLKRNRQLFDRKWRASSHRPDARWHVAITVPRSMLSPAACHAPAFWLVTLHDAAGIEIARMDANAAELRDCLGNQERDIVFYRTVASEAKPVRWTIWPVDRRRNWLERLEGTVEIADPTSIQAGIA